MDRKIQKLNWNSEACRKAREFGIDLVLIEQNLSLTPTERLEKHQAWINEVIELRESFRRQETHAPPVNPGKRSISH